MPPDAGDAPAGEAHDESGAEAHKGRTGRRAPSARRRRLARLAAEGQLPSVRHLAAVVALLLLIVGVSYAADYWTTSNVVVMPGPVTDLRDRVSFPDGPTTFEPKGRIEMVAARSGRATLADHVYARLRDDIELVPLEPGSGAATDRQRRDRDLEMMRDSKDIAAFVALGRLGYEVGFDGEGAIVDAVTTGTAAPGRIREGDVIVEAGGAKVAVASDISAATRGRQPGDELTLTVVRDDQRSELTVPLSESPDGEGRVVIGVVVYTKGLKVTLPFPVEVDTDEAGGPSAGLAISLAIIDALTPGDLTGGHRVAATGALRFDGSVMAVGAIEQKALSASDAGMEYLLVPADSLGEARGADASPAIVPVASVDEALQFFERLRGAPLVLATPPP